MSNCVLYNLFCGLLISVSGIHERNEGVAFLLAEARRGLGQDSRGPTFPTVGLRGETTVFDIVVDLEGKEWTTFERAAL